MCGGTGQACRLAKVGGRRPCRFRPADGPQQGTDPRDHLGLLRLRYHATMIGVHIVDADNSGDHHTNTFAPIYCKP